MPPPPRRSSRQSTATGATTASVTSKKQQQLPSWAKLSRPQRRVDDPLTLAEEEAYMRTKTYFESARLIDLTVNETLQQLLETTNILQEIKDLALRYVHDASGANGGDEKMNHEQQKTSESLSQPINNQESNHPTSEDDDIWSRYKLDSSKPQSRFDPLLLPVLTLDGPTHSLDRYEWMRVLVQACKQQLLQTSVVWLQSFATVSGHGNTSNNLPLSRLTEELTRQCLWQEHERNQDQNLPPTLTQAQLRSCGNCSELLQQWARQTVHFHHGILVLVDAANATTSLLEWASEQRSLHGIPISIVLLSHSSATMLSSGSNLLYYLQTHSDCLVQRKSLPSSQNVLQQVWQALYVKHAFAYHLADQPVLSAVTSAFNDKHGSFVHALMQVKATLADFFASYRGSALMVAATANTEPSSSKPTTTTDMAKRRKWFMLDANAKRYSFPQRASSVHPTASGSGKKRKRKQDEIAASGDGINHNNCDPIACLQELEQHRRQVAIIMQLETCFLQHWRSNVAEKQQQPLHLNTQSLSHAMESSSAFSTEQVSKDAVRDMMALLFRLQQDELDRQAAMIADESINSSLSIPLSKTPNHNSIRAFIHRLVIVLDQASFVSDILYVFDSVHQAWHASLERTLVRRSARQSSTLLQQPIVRPRRDTVLGWVHPAEINIPGLLYRLLNTCCSVTLNDWFAMFVTHQRRELSTLDDNDTQQQLLMFATGVYSLQVQGLIKGERKTSSGKSVFDKSVLVWCGVDE
ncbi:hypothetical protein MPSEU_000771000 [Mayamaea pseudoterrestris]|nr:hypothetical protein MPSEU_000771000 [Mayamaea pseudoterrestris]